ncbi:MAG: cell wall hydrolase [Lachnospiraceae bacterium]|nr:cell wall hydrolase [Lachnospiraceae bacterium]MEE0396703.1 cell wall hydrolase [Lachnospiraceae bacterium]
MKKAALRKAKIALWMAVVLFACSVPSFSYAVTTQDRLNEALKDKDEIKDRLDSKNDHIDDLKDTEAGLQADLKDLNAQMTAVSSKLEELEGQIADKEEAIRITGEEIEEAKKTEAWQYDCMVKRIQYMYESGETDYLELLFSAQSFSDFLNYSDYFSAIADYDENMMAEYEATRQRIEEEEAKLLQEKADLDDLYLAAETEKSKVSGLISQTNSNIQKYGDKIATAEEEARAYEAELKKKEEDIATLKKIIEQEKALSAAAAKATWRDISEVTFADGDKKLLANIIYCEAGAEPYAGKLAVGAVVINRVLSSKYPDTVVGVIYQKSQFSPVASGRYELALAVDKANADCYKAAEEAMSGVTNVGSCLYFRTPIDGLTGIAIGGHIFY